MLECDRRCLWRKCAKCTRLPACKNCVICACVAVLAPNVKSSAHAHKTSSRFTLHCLQPFDSSRFQFSWQVMESSEGSKSSMSVFGSPPEPIFNEAKNGISNELLLDSFKFLSSKNEIAVRGAVPDETGGCFKSGQPVEFLFELCRYFELGVDVQYRAADLYHQFMTNHIVELYQVTSLPLN